jgi:uncharacterized protein involved in exopolysaccharide biosynthesis
MTEKSNVAAEDARPVGRPVQGFEAYLVPIQEVAPSAGVFDGFLRRILGQWKFVSGAAFLGAVVMIGVSFLFPRIYEARVVLMPQAQADASGLGRSMLSQLGGLASIAGNLLPSSSNSAEYVAILKSDFYTSRFIESRQLLPLLFAKEWDSASKAWRDPDDAPTLGDAIEEFNENIRSVAEDKKTGLVTVTVRWRNRQQAAEWANLLVDDVNGVIRRRAIDETKATLGYLKQQLEKTTQVEVQEAIYKLMEGQAKTLMLAETRPDYAFRVIDPARVPEYRNKVAPKRLLFAALGFVLGALFATGWIARQTLREPRVD